MTPFTNIFSIIMVITGVFALFVTIANMIYFKKMRKPKKRTLKKKPLVSVIIPARDEEANLPRLLNSLIKQTYKNIEILIINDQSTDRTEEIIKEFEAKDKRIHGYHTSKDLKISKHGKINAILQLLPFAKGEYLLATDADTQHATTSIELSLQMMQDHNLDIMSGFPTQLCSSTFASILISSMMFVNIFIPHFLFYVLQRPEFTFAIGQYIIMRRDSYYEVGGYGCIQNEVVDDMGIVRLFVKKHKKYAFVNLSELVACYMYKKPAEAFKGIERSIMGVFPAKAIILPLMFIFVLYLSLLVVAPIFLLVNVCLYGLSQFPVLLFIGWILFGMAWYIGCRNINFRALVSLASPVSLAGICSMYIHGLYRRLSGKNFIWKGREI